MVSVIGTQLCHHDVLAAVAHRSASVIVTTSVADTELPVLWGTGYGTPRSLLLSLPFSVKTGLAA